MPQNATPGPQISGPICTEAEVRAAGLDIASVLSELTSMAETIVAAAQDAPGPEVDLARAVPLMAACIERLRAERETAAATIAELEQRLAARERERNADREERDELRDRAAELEQRAAAHAATSRDLLTRTAELEQRVNELVQQRDDALLGLVAEGAAGVEPDDTTAKTCHTCTGRYVDDFCPQCDYLAERAAAEGGDPR